MTTRYLNYLYDLLHNERGGGVGLGTTGADRIASAPIGFEFVGVVDFGDCVLDHYYDEPILLKETSELFYVNDFLEGDENLLVYDHALEEDVEERFPFNIGVVETFELEYDPGETIGGFTRNDLIDLLCAGLDENLTIIVGENDNGDPVFEIQGQPLADRIAQLEARISEFGTYLGV